MQIICVVKKRPTHPLQSDDFGWGSLDYCNSLLNNIPKRDLTKLQRVKIIWHVRFSGRLSFHHHYHYFNSYDGFLFLIELILSCPLLCVVLYLSNAPRQLRSSISQQLILPNTKLNSGKRAFSVAGPRVSNEPPITLKTS